MERRHAQNAEWTAAAPVRVSARGLFACCFKRFCESPRSVGQGRVGGHDLCQAVARFRHVEPLDSGVKSGPELFRTSPAGTGAKLVRRSRGWTRRPVARPDLHQARGRAHRASQPRPRQRSKATTKTRIRRRQLVRPHRPGPRRLRIARGIPGRLLARDLRGPLLFGSLHHAFLPHAAAVGYRRSSGQAAPCAEKCGRQHP